MDQIREALEKKALDDLSADEPEEEEEPIARTLR